ncbi:MAG: fatty acid desaturase [Sodalinema sp.]|uniref:fatty acid desaturase n=1 Tax=Sodalinema sp. TaxID=3080550 RepID=UPI0012217CB6|nr:MAG: fatty acid desaturase [Phormidium sp. SL48-SHIP]
MTASLSETSASRVPSLDADLRIRDILNTLPKSVFVKDRRRAWTTVALDVLLATVGYIGIAIAPIYLLPLLWIVQGTVLTGWFVIGHDCGHRSFAQRKWVNNWLGHLMFLPLLYPFHGWRIQHNHHHKHTNKLGVDNAWDPLTVETYESLPAIVRWLYTRVRGRFWWVGSIGHWLKEHFIWTQFSGQERQHVRFSALFVILVGGTGLGLLGITTGWWGVVKFWLMPWMVYHFWMSTFTIVHHTIPDIHFQPQDTWHEANAQLCGTVHCTYPRWVEFLCHDINVHVPHHLSTAIPWYNLRSAYEVIQRDWGDYTVERQFSAALMREITDHCHLYDSEEGYQRL